MSVDPALWYIVILSLVSSITDLLLLFVHDGGHWLHARRSLSSSPFLCMWKWTTLYRERWEFATCLVRVWLASAFIIRNSDTYKQLFYIMYRVSILWGEKAGGRKWDDQMGEWSGARGCPENGMWVDGGKAWPWIRAWMNVRRGMR